MESIIQDLPGKHLNSIVSYLLYYRIRCERNSKWNFFFPKKNFSSVAYAELFSDFILQILKRQEIITVSGAWCWEDNFRHQSTYIFLVYLKNPTSKRYCLLHYWAIFLWIACMLIILTEVDPSSLVRRTLPDDRKWANETNKQDPYGLLSLLFFKTPFQC